MSKLATTMLSKDKVDLSELRIQIRAVENSVWYKPNNNQAKIVQPRNWGNGRVGDGAGSTGGPTGNKWCGDCNSKTHNPEACWGICPHCGKRGHRQEYCNKKTEEMERAKAAQALNKAEKQKKKREKKKLRDQKKKETGAAAKTAP